MPQIVVALGTHVCAQIGIATEAKAIPTAAASMRDFRPIFGCASTAPTTAPPGALANSDTTCGTPSVRLKTMR
jgi:hypothetical protein